MQISEFLKIHKTYSVIGLIVILIIIYIAQGDRADILYSLKSITDKATVSDENFAYGVPQGVGGDGFIEESSYDMKQATRGIVVPSPIDGYYGSGNDIVIEDAKVIKNAYIDLEVDSVISSLSAIENIAKRLEGFVINSNVSEDYDGNKSGSIVVKVPVTTFDSAREEIKDVGVFIKNENTNSQDVTEEFIDIEARLINLRAQEDSYRTLLDRATKIEDIIIITGSLTNVRTEIEQQEGRKRYLEGQTDFSTITTSLSEEREVTVPSRKWRPLTILKDAARNTIDQLQGFVDTIITFVFWVLGVVPYLIVIAILMWLVKRFKRTS